MKRNTLLRLIASTLGLLALVGGAQLASAQADPHAGDDFLRLVDAKKYAESWDVASEFFKRSVSRAEWAAAVTRARDPLGDLASRQLVEAKPETDPPGAPPGDYLLMTYRTVFASQGAPYTETLPLVKGPDGRYRAVGYFIR